MKGTLAAHSVWSIDHIKDHVSKIGSGVTPSELILRCEA